MPTQSTRPGAPEQLGNRLIKLTAKRRKRGHDEEDAFSWDRTPRRPFWLALHSYAGIIADLHYGELATAQACRRMASVLPEQAAKDTSLSNMTTSSLMLDSTPVTWTG